MIEVRVRHSWPGFTLDAGFTAPRGVTALFGRSGSGKTTILRAVAGLLDAEAAEVRVGGEDLSVLPAAARGVGYVFQDGRLFPHLSVAQNIDFAARFGRAVDAGTRAQIIEMLELGPLLARHPRNLSGGEVQRVAIARALVSAPRLLCMDEPLAALDAARRAQVLPYLERMRDVVDVPMLYVSHDAGEVARLATSLVVVRDGRIAASGPVEEVLADPDAVPALGPRAAGAVLQATVVDQDGPGGLTTLQLSGAQLRLPGVAAPVGARVRLRVAAQDIILARARPEGISALNVLEGRIVRVRMGDGPGAAVSFDVGGDRFLARITALSAREMALSPGAPIWAIVKATAFDPGGIGQ